MIRIANVHHHLGSGPVLFSDHPLFDREVDQAIVDTSASTFGTADRYVHSRLQHLRCVSGPDDTWQSQLAAHNRAVTRSTTTVGNDRRRLFHDGFPRWIGHRSHQHGAFVKLRKVIGIRQHMDLALTDPFADRDSRNYRFAMLAGEFMGLDIVFTVACMYCFRACLEDEELTSNAVLGPFEVHRSRTPGEV